MSILHDIIQLVNENARVPKPKSSEVYTLKRIGISRGKKAVVYEIPKKIKSKQFSEKRIPLDVFEAAVHQIKTKGILSKTWFKQTYPDIDADGSCNFTTLGGVLELLKIVIYKQPGYYVIMN